jgi:hypothetical protein
VTPTEDPRTPALRWRSVLRSQLALPVITSIVAALILALLSAAFYRLRTSVDPASQLLTATVIMIMNPESSLPCQAYSIEGRLPSQVPVPDLDANRQITLQAMERWVRRTGASDLGRTELEVRLQGTSSRAVILEELRVIRDSSHPTVATTAYYTMMGCGGGFEPRRFDIELDRHQPVAMPVPGHDGTRELPAVSFPLRISDAEPETLLIKAISSGHDVSWHLEIPWYSGEQRGILRITPDETRPFTTSGDSAVRDTYLLDERGKTWVKVR